MRLTVILERAPRNWCAYTPDEVGVVAATGRTRDEAIAHFRAALRSHLDVMREAGQAVPDVTELDIRETLALQPA